jgi:spore coat protein H
MLKTMKKYSLILVFALLWACKSKVAEVTPTTTGTTTTPTTTTGITPIPTPIKSPDWTEATHGKKGTPDYGVVFNQTQVGSLEIRMNKAKWDSIKADMKIKYSIDFGVGGGTTPAGGGGNGPVGGGGITPVFGTAEPSYVEVALRFNGKAWYKVGFRLKGNSSLTSIWRSGIYKLPFRLKFDEFEDKYPDIKDQRFYGFQDLSMSPAAKDASLIREKVAADIFRMAGVSAARTAFYKVYIDFGEGVKYCGVYCMVEVVDDTMIKDQFGESKGNIYKPEGTGANFAEGTFSKDDFEKKNNETAADWSDIQAIFTALHAKNRITDATTWRTNLGKVMDMDHFVKWLAVNTTLVNWDTYGAMAHNYYLYNSPTKKMTWIPWDDNEALTSNARVNLPLSGIAATWPLIKYVAEDPVYYAKYKAYVKDFNDNVFTTAKMNDLLDRSNGLIAPFVNGTEKEVAPYTNLTNFSLFTSSLPELKTHVVSRNQAVKDFLK